ncbi:protease complex subunit PrcB family protein [Flavobacterium aquidurense]|uniref:protease complex subunit PrcB family protein n=1 Tax=Flavobacterium aquidurense TaxID=362413 RepID=UPI002856D25B|nr:protease complex subunit PrcB family protein [Flavobacterium aquidurense]MDR7372932.1 hypothetical protein [Flavobacterium aquidurense]
MKQIIFIFSILFAFASCDNDDSNTTTVESSLIIQGDFYNSMHTTKKENLVIKDQKAWNALLASMRLTAYTNYYFPEEIIDFTKYQVIAVFDEVRNYGGYSIDITKITQTKDHIVVKVEQLKTGGLNAVVTQPYHIVKIAKSDKEVVFQ